MKHREILKEHLNEIKQIQSLIQTTMQLLIDIDESNAVYLTTEYNSKINDFRKIPHNVQVSPPTFIPKAIELEKLLKVFGRITPLTTSKTEHFQLPKKSNYSVKELLNEPVIVTQMQTWYDSLYCVSNVDDETLWTSGGTGEIKCFDITTGVLLEKIRTKSGKFPNDIAVDSKRNLH